MAIIRAARGVDDKATNNDGDEAAIITTIIVGTVESVYIDLKSTNREYNYRIRPLNKDSTTFVGTAIDTRTTTDATLVITPESNLQYAPNCPVTVDPSSLPPFVAQHDGAADGKTSNESHRPSNNRRDAKIISSIVSAASAASAASDGKLHYFVDVIPSPKDAWRNMQCTVPSTALQYRPVADQDSTDDNADVSLVETICSDGQRAPPLTETSCADTSTSTSSGDNIAAEDKVQLISPLPPNTASSGQTSGGSDDEPPSVVLPSATSAPTTKDNNTTDMSGQKRPCGPNEVVPEHVIRRIDISDVLDPSVVRSKFFRVLPGRQMPVQSSVKLLYAWPLFLTLAFAFFSSSVNLLDFFVLQSDTLIGSDHKINHKMQNKLGVAIHVLGVGVEAIPEASSDRHLEEFAKLGGGLSPKVGDKCVMMCGEKRKVHEASKVVIHILVNKCYTGGCDSEKGNLREELRIVRQVHVQKQVELPQTTAHPKVSSVPSVIDSAETKQEKNRNEDYHEHPQEPATKRPATINAVEKVREESGWSPSPEESYYGPASQIPWAELQQKVGKQITTNTPTSIAPSLNDFEDSPSQLQLMMLPPQFNGDNWIAKVRSPWKFDFFSLFDTVVPTNIKNKFGRVRVCLLGGPAHSDQDKDLPLHVHLEGSDRLSIERAAEYVASLLVPNLQEQQNENFEGESHFDGKEWVAHVVSPIEINELFAIIVGPGAETKKQLISQFGRCYIRLIGGAEGEPPKVVIKHQNRAVVEAAAARVTTMITGRCQNGGNSDVRPTGSLELDVLCDSRSPMHLVAGPMFKDERSGHWTNIVDSPIGQNELFVMFVGQDAQRKREFEQTFGCNLWIENIGTKVSSGPLQLKISAKSIFSLQIATDRAAHMLYEAARKKDEKQMIRSLIMDEYVHGEKGWVAIIRSPVDPDTLFDATIRNGKKADIIARFGGDCFISIRGDGIKDHLGRNSGGPLRVMVGHEFDRAAGEAAVWHVAELLHRAAAGY